MNKLAVLYAFSRHDYFLTESFKKHLIFKDYVVFNDTTNKELWYYEGYVRNCLLVTALKEGYEWALCLDPDERLLKSDQKKIERIVKSDTQKRTVYEFDFREMFTENKYRTDGKWGRKWKRILFPLSEENFYQNSKIHSHWYPRNKFYQIKKTGIPIYHLKHTFPGAAEKRRAIYEEWDTIMAQKDYSYLTDMTGANFDEAPEEISNYVKQAHEAKRRNQE